jgi:GT2 family glycosyltransferase
MKTKSDISVIIVNHNAKDFLRNTLKSLAGQVGVALQIIVVDNGSTDGSAEMVKHDFKSVTWLERHTTLGFSAANNLGLEQASADTILFLNPDVTFMESTDLKVCYDKLMGDQSIGALTARVNLALTGSIDETCHRGFPTPWAAFTHFSGLSKLFPSIPLFNRYTKRYLGYDAEHEIDAVGGMFMLMRKAVGDSVRWWDEDYPLYGEDLDLCYRLKVAGYRNYYYPKVSLLHYKGITTGMSKQSKSVTTADVGTTRQVKLWSIEAMEIFYRKHYASKYPFFFNWFVYLGIKLLKLRRLSSS